MADIKTIFLGAIGSSSEETELECYCNISNNITISILDKNVDNYSYPVITQLSKETAIRLSKELRKQISLIDESEVQNG